MNDEFDDAQVELARVRAEQGGGGRRGARDDRGPVADDASHSSDEREPLDDDVMREPMLASGAGLSDGVDAPPRALRCGPCSACRRLLAMLVGARRDSRGAPLGTTER